MDYSLPGFPSMGFSRQEYRSGLPLPGGGFSICKRAQRYCYVYCLRGNQDPAPRLHYCSLIVPPLSLHPLPSLINSCLNLPIGTQGRSWRLNEASFLSSRNGEHRKAFCAQEPHRVLLSIRLTCVKAQKKRCCVQEAKWFPVEQLGMCDSDSLECVMVTDSGMMLELLVFVVQSLNHVWLSVTPWNAACLASLSITIS